MDQAHGNLGGVEFSPDADHARLMRDALGRFATGVTVVTCMTGAGPLGITANSFASVSLDPPLVLWSLARASSRFDGFMAAAGWSIHVLGANQHDLAMRFTRGGAGFDGLATGLSRTGTPTLSGALARFDCLPHSRIPAGDHVIFLGQVQHVTLREGAPIVFSQGEWGGFSAL